MTTFRCIGLVALALTMVACGSDDDDSTGGGGTATVGGQMSAGGSMGAGGDGTGGMVPGGEMTPGGEMAPGGGEMAPGGGEMAPGGGEMAPGGTPTEGGAMAEGGAMSSGGAMAEGGAMVPGGGGDMDVPEACQNPDEEHFYSYSAMSFTYPGEEVQMCVYSGRVILVANTAANCGLTNQYEWLQEMDDRYRMQGLTILGFLSNDFGNQGGTDEEVAECEMDYGVKFEQFAIIGVTPNSASGQDPIFAWLTTQMGMEGVIPWNFSKFLVSHDGRLLGRWAGGSHRMSKAETEQAIIDALAELE